MNKRPAQIKSFTLMVCTYRRPNSLKVFLEAVRKLDLPEGLDFKLAIADNNPSSAYEAYIKDYIADMPFPVVYGHEPQTGYSSARNKALELAAQDMPDVLAFADDDLVLASNWVHAHLHSLADLNCDIASGGVEGHRQRFEHGDKRRHCGAGNVAFYNWIVSDHGLALRFDAKFNKTGFEDQKFFRAAHDQGAVIRRTLLAVAKDTPSNAENQLEDNWNRALVASVTQRNKVVMLRRDGKYLKAFLRSLSGFEFAVKAIAAVCTMCAARLNGDATNFAAQKLNAFKEWRKAVEVTKGLVLDYAPRQNIRQND